MPTPIDHAQLRSLLDEGDVQLVEVLPAENYDREHLPGAINIPLKTLDADSVQGLNRLRPVVVYCWDYI
jgi:rhodanese-related sulfurtransferase